MSEDPAGSRRWRCDLGGDERWLSGAAGDDQFDRLPDALLLVIFNRIGNVKALGRCSLVSRRFHELVPLVDSVLVRVDCVIPDEPPSSSSSSSTPSSPTASVRARGVFSQIARIVLGGIVKPIQALGQILSPANSASGFPAWSREARRLEAVHLEQVGAALAERGHGLLHGPVEGAGAELVEVLPAGVADGLDDHERGAVDPGAVRELQQRRVAQLHVAGGHLGSVGGGGGRGGERTVPELPELVAPHAERALPAGVRQRHPLQGGVLLDDLAKEVVPGGRGDEGADGPDDAQLEAAVGVQGLRDAAAVVVARGGSGGGGVRRSRGRGAVHPGAAEDDAALQRAAEHGLPPEHDAVVGAHVGDRELHPEAADAAEVPQHLGGRVVLLRVLLRRRGLGVAANGFMLI
ncbi:F-box protein [Zea mays]|uniref:F-box protein n=1 Tax=Zea mays TaxID=4577 RepID=A0A1D6EX51_MAIZE|nr:F-box protein [Zea mays]